MLVTFESEVGGFSMFGDVAVTLLKMMGHSGTVPSAMLAADIPDALARLQQQLASVPRPADDQGDDENRKKEPVISLHTRAVPLIELFERAAKRGKDVLWR